MKTFPAMLAGRCATGEERGHGRTVHAITTGADYSAGRSLCGAKPGRLSAGWAQRPGAAISCSRCASKARLVETFVDEGGA